MAMTVERLKEECEKQIAKGNGKREVFLSNDDEGNGYHGLYYSFTDDKKTIRACDEFNEISKNGIILG